MIFKFKILFFTVSIKSFERKANNFENKKDETRDKNRHWLKKQSNKLAHKTKKCLLRPFLSFEGSKAARSVLMGLFFAETEN